MLSVPLVSAHHQLPANETSFLIKNLQPGASYTVSIGAQTRAGEGPNSTANFATLSIRTGMCVLINELIMNIYLNYQLYFE